MKKKLLLILLFIAFTSNIGAQKQQKITKPTTRVLTTTTVSNGQTVVIWGQFADAATGGGGGGIGGGGGGGGGTAAGGGGGYGGGAGGVIGGGGGGINVGNSSISGGGGLGYGGLGGGGGILGNSGGNGAGSAGKISGGFLNGAKNGSGGGISGANKGGDGFGGGGGTSVGGGGAGVTQGGEGFGLFGASDAGAGGNLGITPSSLSIGTGNTLSHSDDVLFIVNGGVLDIFGGSGGGGGNINSGSDANGITTTITSQTGGIINLLGGVGGGGGMLSSVKGGDGAGSIISNATITGGTINVFGGAGGGGNSIGVTGSKGGNGTGGRLLGGSLSNATLNIYGGANGQNATLLGFGTGNGGTGEGGYVSDFTLSTSGTLNMYTGSNAISPNTLPAFGGMGSTANNITNNGGDLNLNGGTLQGNYNQSAGSLNLNGGTNNAACTFSGGSINNTTGTKDYTLSGATFSGGSVTTSSIGSNKLTFSNALINSSTVTVGNNVALSGTTTLDDGSINLNPGSTLEGNYHQTKGTLYLNGGTNNATATFAGGTILSTVNNAVLENATITGPVNTGTTNGTLVISNPTISSNGVLSVATNVTLEGSVKSGAVNAFSSSRLRGVSVDGANVTMNTGSSILGDISLNSGSLNVGSGTTLSYDLTNYTGGISTTGGTLNILSGSQFNPSIDLTSVKPGVFELVKTSSGGFNSLDLSSIRVTYQGNPVSTSGFNTAFSVSADGSSLILTVNKSILDCIVTPIPNQLYSGNPITPSIEIKDGSNILAVNTDYLLTFSNNISVGTASVTITGKGSYAGSISASFTITPMPITVKADPLNKRFGSADPAFVYHISSGALVGNDVFSGFLAREAGESVGTYNITQGTLSLSTNYSLNFIGNVLSIAKADQEITFESLQLAGKRFGDAPFTVNASASSGLPIIFTSSDPNIASIDASGLITINKPGAVTITASQPGNSSFNAANSVIQNLAIDSAFIGAISLGFSNIPDQIYTGLPITPAISITDNGVSLIKDLDYSVSYVNNIIPGPAIITITGLGNYKGTINKAFNILPINLVVKASDNSKIFGTSDPVLTYQIVSGELINGDAFTGELIRVAGEDCGSYTIQKGTLSLTENYNITFTEGVFTISKANQSITFDPTQLTNLQYGDTPFTLAAASTSGLPITFSSSDTNVAIIDATGLLTIKGAGNCNITASQGGNQNFNAAPDIMYSMSVIGKPISATDVAIASIEPQPYNGSEIVPTISITDSGSNTLRSGRTLVENTDYQVSFSNNKNAGVATATITGIGNYSGTIKTSFTINPLSITISADGKSKVYAKSDPNLTYQVTSGKLVGSDTFTGALTREAGEEVGSYQIMQGTVSVNKNYNITYVKNYLSIVKADQTISLDESQFKSVKAGQAPFSIVASSSSGLPITFSSSDTDVATVDANGVLTILSDGETFISAEQNGNSNYNAAQAVVIKLVVGNSINATTEIEDNQMIAYPNPVFCNSELTIKTDVEVRNAWIYMYDATGKLVFKGQVVNSLTKIKAPTRPGVYMLKLADEKGFDSEMKIIVK